MPDFTREELELYESDPACCAEWWDQMPDLARFALSLMDERDALRDQFTKKVQMDWPKTRARIALAEGLDKMLQAERTARDLDAGALLRLRGTVDEPAEAYMDSVDDICGQETEDAWAEAEARLAAHKKDRGGE